MGVIGSPTRRSTHCPIAGRDGEHGEAWACPKVERLWLRDLHESFSLHARQGLYQGHKYANLQMPIQNSGDGSEVN